MTLHRISFPQPRLRLALAVLVSAWIATTLGAQSPAAGNAKLYPVAGTLIDKATGKPISGGSMQLSNSAGFHENASTDSQGRFSLSPVPAGKYAVDALKDGYLTEAFEETEDELISGVVVGEGQDTQHLAFGIDPWVRIVGRVTDDAGEPVAHAQVTSAHWITSDGLGGHLKTDATEHANDLGEFIFWHSYPGKYAIAVTASPWFAIHPSTSQQNQTLDTAQRQAQAALDVAYPVTYYGDTTEAASATMFSVTQGTFEANISLHAVPAIHLTLHVPPEGNRPSPTVKQKVFGEYLDESLDDLSDDPSSVEYALAPGHYLVQQDDPPGVAEIDPHDDLELNLASAAPAQDLKVKIQMEDGEPVPASLKLTLASGDLLQRKIEAKSFSGGEAIFPAVIPGTWTALASASDTAMAVVAVQSGSATRPGDQVAVTGNASELTLSLARDKTRIQGFAMRDDKEVSGVMMVLVPKDPSINQAKFARDETNSDGSFELPAMPGEYTIVAIDDGWDLAWKRPEVVQKYLASGVPITVSETSEPVTKLTTSVPVQTR